jgi:hypothetical protein
VGRGEKSKALIPTVLGRDAGWLGASTDRASPLMAAGKAMWRRYAAEGGAQEIVAPRPSYCEIGPKAEPERRTV